MPGRNEQRKPGTARGSPRRSRTAKASRISRHAVKSRCAHEWDGWGRLRDDGPGHYNPDLSEGPWGGGVMTLQGGAQSSPRPDTVRDNRGDHEVHEGRMQTGHRTANAGSRLKPLIIGKAPLGKPAFQPYWGKPAVRNDRGIEETLASFEARSAPRSYPTPITGPHSFGSQSPTAARDENCLVPGAGSVCAGSQRAQYSRPWQRVPFGNRPGGLR
jgi:hypothetical protein